MSNVIDNAGDTAETAAGALISAYPAFGPIEAELKTDLDTLIKAYEDALVTYTKTLIASTPIDTIEASLQKIGVQLSNAVAPLDKVLDGLRSAVTTYTARAQQILAAAVTAAKSKISVRINYEAAQSSGIDYALVGHFTSLAGHAGDLYRAMAFGQLSGAQRAFATPVVGFVLDPASTVTRLSGRKLTLGYDAVLLRLTISGSDVLASDAQATVDALGNVTIAAQASQAAAQTAGNHTDTLAFSTSYAFKAAARDIADSRPIIKLGLTATIGENRLERSNVTAFLGRLEGCGLLSTDRTTRANPALDSWTSTKEPRQSFGGTLAITLNVDAPGMAMLLGAGRSIGDATAPSIAGLAVFRQAIAAMDTTGKMTTHNTQATIALFDGAGPLSQIRAQYPDDVAYLYHVVLDAAEMATLHANAAGLHHGNVNAQLMNLLFDIEAALAFVKLLAALAAADALDVTRLGAGAAAAVASADARIAEQARPWLAFQGPPLLALDSQIQKRTAALFLALARVVTGTDAPPAGTFDRMFTILITNTTTKAVATV